MWYPKGSECECLTVFSRLPVEVQTSPLLLSSLPLMVNHKPCPSGKLYIAVSGIESVDLLFQSIEQQPRVSQVHVLGAILTDPVPPPEDPSLVASLRLTATLGYHSNSSLLLRGGEEKVCVSVMEEGVC